MSAASLCRKIAISMGMFVVCTAGFAQDPNALSTYLNMQKLSPLPNSFSFYKPGALIIYRYNQNGQSGPDYRDPETDALNMDASLASGLLPSIDITTENHLSIAAALFGVDPQAKFSSTETLTTAQIPISGYRLTSQQIDALKDPNSATFKAAKDAFVKNHISILHPVIKDTEVYLIDSVFTTTEKVNIHKKSGTQVVLSSGEDVSCDDQAAAKDKTANKQNPAGQQTGTQADDPTKKDGEAPPATKPAPSNGQSQTVQIIDAVGSAAKNLIPSSQTADGKDSKTKVKDLGNGIGYSAGVGVCRNKDNTVTLSSQTPMPFAMVLRRITFVGNFTSMNATIQPVTW